MYVCINDLFIYVSPFNFSEEIFILRILDILNRIEILIRK